MKKGSFSNILLVLMLIVGLSLLLYPSFSDYWNSLHQNYAIAEYVEQVSQIDEDQYQALWQDARDHNRSLLTRDNPYLLLPEQEAAYPELLNLTGSGIMGYISIPCINVNLPVYHTTAEPILQVAIGHLEWTSLPTGGESTHCVVSGHRGLPSARLFTDLDKVTVGDIFLLNILDETLTYEVDQIKIVEPFDTSDLLITEGEDYVTLVTCTPYGINSHRMLVRGTRIANIEEVKIKRVTADAVQIEPLLVAPLLAAPILLVLLILILLPKHNKNRRNDP